MSSASIFLEKNKWRTVWILRFRLLWRLKKQGSCFLSRNSFSTYFLPQKSKKHHKNLVKPIHDLKKNTLKPETKNLYGAYMFFRRFQCKKTPSLNSFYHMKPFDIKINHVCGWNSRQQQLSLYTLKFSESLSLLSPKKNRKKKWSLVHNWIFEI